MNHPGGWKTLVKGEDAGEVVLALAVARAIDGHLAACSQRAR